MHFQIDNKHTVLKTTLAALVILCISCSPVQKPPAVIDGRLDLSQWNFIQDGLVSLDGQWSFTWQSLSSPLTEEGATPEQTGGLLKVPGTWNQFSAGGRSVGAKGYGTYSLKLTTPGNIPILGLYIKSASSAYRLFINGRLVISNGTVSESESSGRANISARVGYFIPAAGENQITIHVSNYHHRYGGIWNNIKLGIPGQINKLRGTRIGIELFVVGILVVMALYHFTLYYMRRKDPSILYFSLVCSIIALRGSVTGERFLVLLEPNLPFSLYLKTEYVTYFLAVPLGMIFMRHFFDSRLLKKVNPYYLTAGVLFSLVALVLPVYRASFLIPWYHFFVISAFLVYFYVLFSSLFKRKEGSKAFMAGTLLLVLATLNDILNSLQSIYTFEAAHYGLMGFIFSQAYVLSRRFSRALNVSEELTEKLEDRVQQRTRQLSLAKEEADRLNEFTRLLTSTSDFDTMVDNILQYLQSARNIDVLWLLLVDQDKNELYTYRVVGELASVKENQDYLQQFRQPLDKKLGTLYQTWLNQRPFYIPDVNDYIRSPGRVSYLNHFDNTTCISSKTDREISARSRVHSFYQFPLIVDQRCIGILNLTAKYKEDGFSKEDLQRIESLCRQVSGLLHNALLLDETRRAKEAAEEQRLIAQKSTAETGLLNEITRRLNQSANPDEITGIVFDYIESEFNLDASSLFLVNKERRILEFYRYSAAFEQLENDKRRFLTNLTMPLIEDSGIVYKAYKRKRTVYMARTGKSTGYMIDDQIVEILGLNSLLLIPLLIKDEVIGILWITNFKEHRRLKKNEVNRIDNFAQQVAGALYTANLLKLTDQARQQAEQQRNETDQISRLIRDLNENLDIDRVMHKLHSYMTGHFKFRYYALSVYDHTTDSMKFTRYHLPEQVNEKEIKKIEFMPAEKGLHSLVAKSGRPYFTNNEKMLNRGIEEERVIKELTGMRSLLLVPLTLQNEMIGFLHFFDTAVIDFKDKAHISLLGEQVAGIIYGSNLLKEIQTEREASEKLLLNILPAKVARELKERGEVEPQHYQSASMLFTDFKGFTRSVESMKPEELIRQLDAIFGQFDHICERHNLEKIKTIGDAFMCAGGLPEVNATHTVDACMAALEMRQFMHDINELRIQFDQENLWQIRIGIHTGSVMAGVAGTKKFTYDLWGDAVNTAARMESSSQPGCINISADTFRLVEDFFICTPRGEIETKGKGLIEMYFLEDLKSELKTGDGKGLNDEFYRLYNQLKSRA